MTRGLTASPLDWLIDSEEGRLMDQRDTLIHKMASTIGTLTDAIHHLEGITPTSEWTGVNSLGVLQFQGIEIDRMCGELAQRLETLRSLRRAVNAEREEA